MDKTRIKAGATALVSLALEGALQVSGGYTNTWLAWWLVVTAFGSGIFALRPHWGAIELYVRSPITVNPPQAESTQLASVVEPSLYLALTELREILIQARPHAERQTNATIRDAHWGELRVDAGERVEQLVPLLPPHEQTNLRLAFQADTKVVGPLLNVDQELSRLAQLYAPSGLPEQSARRSGAPRLPESAS